jgi:hypothetical protein
MKKILLAILWTASVLAIKAAAASTLKDCETTPTPGSGATPAFYFTPHLASINTSPFFFVFLCFDTRSTLI